MLDIDWTEDHTAFRTSVRRFAAHEVAPLVEEAETTGEYPLHLRKRAAEAGLIGLTVPEQFGGAGAGTTYACIATEELSRVCAGLASGISMGLGTGLLCTVGTQNQRDLYLTPTLAGETSGAFAMTEPGAGSDVLAMQGKAVRTAAGWRITANKMYATMAPFADYIFVAVYTAPERRSRGISLFIVDKDTPGLEIRNMDKLGHRSMETGMVFLDCEVPDSALLGEEGAGMGYIVDSLEAGRLSHAARSLGVARAAYEAAAEYAGQRSTFGKLIGEHQAIQFKLARMYMTVRNAALNVMVTARDLEEGRQVPSAVSAAKVVASEAAVSVAGDAMQIFGGLSYMMESPVQRYLRDAHLYPISEGTTEIQLRTIAKLQGYGVPKA